MIGRDAGRAVLLRLESLIMWMFDGRLRWVHVLFGGLALSWAAVHLLNPEELDRGTYAAINWLPDGAWIGTYLILATLHGIGIWRPDARRLRALACLASAWVWIVLGLTFGIRNGLTPGALVYCQVGILAVSVALFISWRGE